MNKVSYNPKELLSVLIDLDGKLKSTVDKNCPETSLNISDDLDDALEDFLKESNLVDNDIGFLTSQMALLQLQRELKKTIDIVVDTNDLAAFRDFEIYRSSKVSYADNPPKWKLKEMAFGALAGAILVSVILFFIIK